MKLIGITGPTGAGKTTALHALASLGAAVIDADAMYHDLLSSDQGLKEALAGRFGRDLLDGEGQIARKRLGEIVFTDHQALEDLNAITHRFILEELARRTGAARREGRSAVAVDAIRLIESGIGASCDAVVGILAPAGLRVRRIMAREGISEAYARKRVEAQPDDDFYRAHCSHILENGPEDTPETFRRRALALFRTLL
ncbi:MAG: dephospho-CoA kinase [Clostridiales bacterium]|nr:dephospho-CoA kinase [Clostridiales bacterium]